MTTYTEAKAKHRLCDKKLSYVELYVLLSISSNLETSDGTVDLEWTSKRWPTPKRFYMRGGLEKCQSVGR